MCILKAKTEVLGSFMGSGCGVIGVRIQLLRNLISNCIHLNDKNDYVYKVQEPKPTKGDS